MIEKVTEKKKLGMGAKLLLVLIGLVLILLVAVLVMRAVGKHNLKQNLAGTESQQTKQEDGLKENQLVYDGKVYQLNEDVVSILVMGIDAETVETVGGQSWHEDASGNFAGGQADTLFLMLINPHTEDISLLAINRNTMADVDVWDEDGNYIGILKEQIALQHGYGDGGEESCLRQVKAVSRLLNNIPINGYAAISMDGVPKLTDAVGGITVEVLDDIVYPEYNMDLHQGERVKLDGKSSYWYVRLRDENLFNSNELRLNRQKQYLTAFIDAAKTKCTSDVRVAADLYSILSDYMVTDIDLNKFTYMATEYRKYNFNTDNIYSLQGEVMQGNKFEEFYVDEESKEQLIVNLFYEPVD